MLSLFLRNINKASFNRDLPALEKLIHQLLKFCPIPVVTLERNSQIQRIRNNFKGEIFTSEKEISYRRDIVNISEFGRANFPNSGMFYGALSSKYLNEIRVVNVLETNKEFRENLSVQKKQVFTSGQWLINFPLRVAIFPFNKFAKIKNAEIRFHSSQYDQIISSFSLSEQAISNTVLPFLSSYFSIKDIKSHWDYILSAFFSEFVLEKYNLDGILYPSVRADFKAYNLMLCPSAANTLHFNNAAMSELFLNRKSAFIDNMASGEVTPVNNIIWTQLERTSEMTLNKILN